jgi:hypothetical protein
MSHLPGHILAVEDNRIHCLKLSRSLEQGYIITLADLGRELEKLGKAGALAGAAELLVQAEAAYEEVKTTLQTIQ